MQTHESANPSAAEVQNLAGLLQYQAHSVVSRVLLKKPNGNVTLFAFGQGEELSEHTTPFDALVVCLDGTIEIHIAGQSYRVSAGETITLPANQPHAVKALSDFKMLLIMIK